MIEREYIVGVRRGPERLPAYEIQQMAGRCGRSYTSSGKVSLVVPPEDEAYAERCLFGEPEPICSSLDAEAACFGVLPHIRRAVSFGKEDFDSWYGRSLAAVQGVPLEWDAVKSLLLEYGAVTEEGEGIARVSPLGELSVRFYYPPRRVFYLHEKMSVVPSLKQPENMAWLLSYGSVYAPKEAEDIVEEYRDACRLSPYDSETNEGACYYALMTGRRPKPLAYALGSLRRDFSRLCACTEAVAGLLGHPEQEVIGVWQTAVVRGLPYALAEIAQSFPSATRPLLAEMEAVSIRKKEDALSCRYSLSPELQAFLKENG